MTAAPGFQTMRLLLAVLFVAVMIGGTILFRDSLSLSALSVREGELKAFQADHPVIVYGLAFLIYVGVTGLSLPGATVLTLTCGWFFGFWRALVLVSFASTTGATVAFLVSRYLLRDSIQRRFGDRLQAFNQALEREGAFYLFMLRLTPVVPFFVINVVMGLTPMRPRTFWWVSQLGMFPATVAFVYAGSNVPSLGRLATDGVGSIVSPQLLAAFAILGVMPLVIRKLVGKASSVPESPEAGREPLP